MMATVEAPTRPPTRLHDGPFVNEPLTDFTKPENARQMRAAIEKVRGQLGREYNLIIGGKPVQTKDKIKSINPAKPAQIVGLHQKAGKEHVEPAMQAALEAFATWSRTLVEERASLLFSVGDLLRERKFEFCAWLVFEVSKNWAEADADIAETIDFCEYYSREVGLDINKSAATQAPGQVWIKRTILEMGGKDAIIVDTDADIDTAVEGVAQAAFGFQGQKCSACSRAIVDERIYDKFLEKLKSRTERITVGDPTMNPNMAAVINEGSMNDILRYIEIGKKDGRLITGGARDTSAGEGYCIKPTVIADIPAKSKLEQEEIFGPVLVVIKSRNFDHA